MTAAAGTSGKKGRERTGAAKRPDPSPGRGGVRLSGRRRRGVAPRARVAFGRAHEQRRCRVNVQLALAVKARSRFAGTTFRLELQLRLVSPEHPAVPFRAAPDDAGSRPFAANPSPAHVALVTPEDASEV